MPQFDIDSALQRLAERRIEEAMREGKFDNLPGRGRPLDLDAMPVDENARMVWWAMRLMRNGKPTPEQAGWCKEVEALKDELAAATTEARVHVLVAGINQLVRRIELAGRETMSAPVAAVDLASELKRLRARLWECAPRVAIELRACANRLCESANPRGARFCRRCGTTMA